ncbi:hypothetical protein ARMGADRAFT_1158949 [Armillaria gallica]|uniref:Uncharacterized protein n=1 Tax=Armillaria gallica TaxID=47427 RepID=A0A2H3E4N5_ARMGA|nr:hypothetical protein ARMGADRAFT_1158949 [Armillaria gallica]
MSIQNDTNSDLFIAETTATVDDDEEPWHRPKESARLPKVNISAFTETGQEESLIAVPKQRAYTGREPVISSRLADTPCAILGVRRLLYLLNTTLRTSHSLDTPSLSSLLKKCIANNYDFGTAYSRLRRIWYTRDWSTIRNTLRKWKEKDQKMRQEALVANQIVNPELPPRYVWDLYSNRVVPRWSTGQPNYFRPISHSWMDEKDRTDVLTLINEYEWPVPTPKDANLNLIRIEMLNLGAEYAWLDVLCLRQKGGRRDDLRAEEWKVDVPTIGAVYQDARVAYYLSGLGRPLTLKEGDLDSDRSWFRRAWTLQEIGGSRIIAGDTPHGPMHAKHKDGKYETELLTRFHEQLKSIDERLSNTEVLAVLEGMRKRVSTNPVDKIAGLSFGLFSNLIPAYYESQSLEDAWTALLNSMDPNDRGVLFFCCPEPGNAGTKWRPSWDQIMTNPLPNGIYTNAFVDRDEKMNEYYCDAKCIENGLVRGLAAVEGGDRHGELIVKDKGGIERRFKITATHEYLIPEDTYTLILTFSLHISSYSTSTSFRCYCIVGRSLGPGERFEKVSVLQILDEGEVDRLRVLYITTPCRYILV